MKRRKGFVTYRVYAEPYTGTVCREQNPIELPHKPEGDLRKGLIHLFGALNHPGHEERTLGGGAM